MKTKYCVFKYIMVLFMLTAIFAGPTSFAQADDVEWDLSMTIPLDAVPEPFAVDYDDNSGLLFISSRNGHLAAYDPDTFQDGQLAIHVSSLATKYPDDCQGDDSYGDVVVSPNGQWVTLMDESGELYIAEIDPSGESFVSTIKIPEADVCRRQTGFRGFFDAGSNNFYVAGTIGLNPGFAKVFDPNNGQLIAEVSMNMDYADGLSPWHWIAPSSDGQTVLIAGFNGGGYYWTTDIFFATFENGSLTVNYEDTFNTWPDYIQIGSPQPNYGYGNNGWVYIPYSQGILAFDMETREKIRENNTIGEIRQLAYSDTVDMLIGTNLHQVFFIDPDTLQLIGQGSYTVPGSEYMSYPDISDDGQQIYIPDRNAGVLYVLEPANQIPVPPQSIEVTIPEGGSGQLDASAAYDPDEDPLTFWWDYENNGEFIELGPTPVFDANAYDGPQSLIGWLKVCDPTECADPVSVTITIVNVAPTASFIVLSTVEGDDIVLSLVSPFDPSPDDTAAGFEYAFDCGDGLGYSAYGVDNSISCPTTDNGSRTVKAKIRDKDNGETEYEENVQVNNVAPSVGPITVSSSLISIGTTIAAAADFTDPGTADTHTAEWDWGDGSTTAGVVSQGAGAGSVSGSHAYTTAAIYTITLTITDDDGGEGETVYQSIVVYDPDGGFATFGGWIDSPVGAFLIDPDLTEKVTFGGSIKFKRGASVPSGNLELQIHGADFNFHVSAFEWLVVFEDGSAQFKGVGTINGEGEYQAMVWVSDGEFDTFHIKIWKEDEFGVETVIYDNGFDQEITGGNIVIHEN